MLRLRRKQGTATGFTIVDVGGNWLRFYESGDANEEFSTREQGLARVLQAATRQGDARGDDTAALDVIERGLARHPDAAAADRARAHFYRIELLVRLGRTRDASAALHNVECSLEAVDAALFADDLRHAHEVVASGAEPGAAAVRAAHCRHRSRPLQLHSVGVVEIA